MLVWVTFKNVPEEYLSSSQEMARSLGVVLGHHCSNPHSYYQKFCIAINTYVPFDLTLEGVNPVNEETMFI